MSELNMPSSEDGVGLICLERNRQAVELRKDDSRHKPGVLSEQAAFVLREGASDPWSIKAKHPNRLEQLIIAGALIAAEIDKMLTAKDSSDV